MSFARTETGAVTVDWVVLTAGLVGLGLATMTVVSTGVQDASEDTNAVLTQDGIIQTSFGSQIVRAGPYYEAYVSIATANPAGLQILSDSWGIETGHDDIENIYYDLFSDVIANRPDDELAADTTARIQEDVTRQHQYDQLSLLPDSGVTTAQIAASYPYPVSTAAVQSDIDAMTGGDVDQYREYFMASTAVGLAHTQAMIAEADRRGLTY